MYRDDSEGTFLYPWSWKAAGPGDTGTGRKRLRGKSPWVYGTEEWANIGTWLIAYFNTNQLFSKQNMKVLKSAQNDRKHVHILPLLIIEILWSSDSLGSCWAIVRILICPSAPADEFLALCWCWGRDYKYEVLLSKLHTNTHTHTHIQFSFATHFLAPMQYIYNEDTFQKPMFITYFNTSLLIVYNLGFLLPSWRAQMTGATWVPVDESGDDPDSNSEERGLLENEQSPPTDSPPPGLFIDEVSSFEISDHIISS